MIILKKVLIIVACLVAIGMPNKAYAEDLNIEEEKESFPVEEKKVSKIPISVSADIAIYSDYIWRGFILDDDPVMQSGAAVELYGLKAIAWGNFGIDNSDDLDSVEFDITLDYTYKYKVLSLSAGHTWYNFPPIDGRSLEFYIGGALDILLSPSFVWYHDYGNENHGGGDGDYFIFSAAHGFPLMKFGENDITLDIGGHIGYNHKLFMDGDGGDFAIGGGLTIPINKYASFIPSVAYSVSFGDLARENDGNQKDKLYFGGKLVFSY
ncbi:MAG: hypothetical protein KKD29_03520 [Candidatus Omnitrophica bacterium]|nr:hypothetical protein [Candidatus Omnitrophota bacterium]MBU4488163.1 hypothetical protein [Candidatus Omnitrophota bacterium]MCG2704709.1 hypothetical protein [Candidatus Omnitrophota bacterium]